MIGKKIRNFITLYGSPSQNQDDFQAFIATHILESYSSCIDFIFTTQPNLVVESSIHQSLHPNCYHQIVLAKFNLQIYYAPPYPREIWHYKQGDTELIRRGNY